MTFYQIIYSWFEDLLDGANLSGLSWQIGGVSMTMDVWLCHTATIICLILTCAFLFGCVKYLFKAGAGLFKW